MAVLESNQTVSNNRNGFDKEIHKSARTMMLDNIQNFIYQRPIPSCVRETVSNCIDATNEKLVAIKIINGELDVKEVYKTLDDVEVAKEEDNIYADSEFKRDYYDPAWLSSSNRIDIKYVCNTVIGERDTFSITDNGVGIGGARLEGIFSLGFSTKRLNTNELGGFGIGQKSALATGVASYRMLTRHNGKEFKFDIFSHKVENVNSKWAEDGSTNPYIEFENTLVDHPEGLTHEVMVYDNKGLPNGFITETVKVPYKAFYTPTTKKNGTTIEFEVKSHNKQAFIDAVKSQLMYLKDDIVFTLTDTYGRDQDIPFKASPIYEDDNIILSNYGFYNRPHFVIKGIAYGVIDFAEAELSPKFGNMGFKCSMEKLDVVPSRESVRYTPKTTAAIIEVYEKNKATVEKMLQDELSETKFLPWIQSANKITSRSSNGNSQDIITRLSSLADQSELNLVYNNDIKYSSSFKTMFGPLFRLEVISLQYGGKVKREESDYTLQINNTLHFQFAKSSARTSAYIIVGKSNFSVFRMNKNYNYLAPIFADLVNKKYANGNAFIAECEAAIDENEIDDTKRKNIKEYLPKAAKMISLLIKDNLVPSYDDLQVPEDFTISEDVAESDVAEKLDAERQKQILKERRTNREFYIQTFVIKSTWTDESKLSRKLIKFTDLDAKQSEGCKLVYFTEDSNEDVVNFVKSIKIVSSGNNPLDNKNLLIFKIAKSNFNQVKAIATPIEKWFFNIDEDGVLKLAPEVSAYINNKNSYGTSGSWNNVNMAKFVNQGFHEKVTKLHSLNENVIRLLHTPETTSVLNKIEALNKVALSYDNDYESEELSKAILNFNTENTLPTEVTKIDVLNPEILQLTEECQDFSNVYGKFLNRVDIKHIPEELEIVLQNKKDQLKFKFKGLHDDINS